MRHTPEERAAMLTMADAYLTERGAHVEVALAAHCDACPDVPPRLLEAIQYSLLGGGKRLRPALALGAAGIVGGEEAVAMPAACAVEMIHCYSLIHDDLPAMDDDDLRRGKPTVHKVFGEALAILAGDALSTMAFDVAAECGNARIVREIAVAAGPAGMAGGQVLDLEGEGRQLSLAELRRMHALKTGALIRASVRCGAILGGADDAALAALTMYGEHVGVAFQIADDILDVVGSETALGKRVGADAAHDKSTYPALLGLEAARRLADEAASEAVAALEPFGVAADPFRRLAWFIVERDR